MKFNITTNASFDVVESGDFTGLFLLDATDSSGTDSGSSILNEEFGSNNNITMDGTDSDSTDAGAKLLQDVAAADGSVSIDGTDSSGTNVDDNIINESPIDFFEDATGINPFPTTITDSSGATAKILKANIAKGSSIIDVLVDTDKSYGVNIQSLIGEDLNRIQDSYYYQQYYYCYPFCNKFISNAILIITTVTNANQVIIIINILFSISNIVVINHIVMVRSRNSSSMIAAGVAAAAAGGGAVRHSTCRNVRHLLVGHHN